ncbi:glutathionylspermidine synthase family protein [Bacillus mycoides]|uniref:Glutathionylspermidine synthase pre-ATP-grasp-like domain-containing protein n=1 Tax=Bacillus mycoides TaxID=1405 RepID=A0ABC9QV25_BACMY|nr:glutathionylspermidine synthase family protein [Bacillus mycoides]EJR30022.1 hypothetical protein III_05791 [Bacillus mycoides]
MIKISENLTSYFQENEENAIKYHNRVFSEIIDKKIFHFNTQTPIFSVPIVQEEEELERINTDCKKILDLIVSLTQRLSEEDSAQLFEKLGYSIEERELLEATLHSNEGMLARSDMIIENNGYKIIEFNVESSVGGTEIGNLNNLILKDGFFNSDTWKFKDPNKEIVKVFKDIIKKHKLNKKQVTLGIMDWYPDMMQYIYSHEEMQQLFAYEGIKAVICHQENIEIREGNLFTQGEKVDILFRLFLLDDIKGDTGKVKSLLEPYLLGNLIIINGIHTDLYSNKGNFAFLSDSQYQYMFNEEERKIINRCIPWSRFLEKDRLVNYEGENYLLHKLLITKKDAFVLKPLRGYGGDGVIIGKGIDQYTWELQLKGIFQSNRKYLVQERVESKKILMPYVENDKVSYLDTEINYATYIFNNEYSGSLIRGISKDKNTVNNVAQGALMGSLFYI